MSDLHPRFQERN